ncbi:hypothetical protein [Phycicoccus avicenniae]|uniref:hypothetical protein n=1 Tax=Phycicoccus avicenniae TaxID=2828860 RepID=UPI003D2692A8
MSRGSRWREVEGLLDGLDGVRLKEDPRGRRWCVGQRLVARQVDDSTLLVRCAFGPREELLAAHPETFSVRPELEAHEKVLADVSAGDLGALGAALRAAWEMQRR